MLSDNQPIRRSQESSQARSRVCVCPGIAALIFILLVAGATAARAEWGYDAEPATASANAPLPAACQHTLPPDTASGAPNRPAAGLARSGSPGFARIGSPSQFTDGGPSTAQTSEEQTTSRAIDYWLELYSLVNPALDQAGGKSQLRAYLTAKLSSHDRKQMTGIVSFWPRVKQAMAAVPGQKESYSDLFRALLRAQARAGVRPPLQEQAGLPTGQDVESQGAAQLPAVDDSSVLTEILGPARIAVPSSPPLTEDVVNAYADMACFLYEQKHPGKTLDASDNRTIFANVVREKFTSAPTNRDRQAMLNFDLCWAKFKIVWNAGTEASRRQLLAAWGGGPAASGQGGPADPTLEAVLCGGPWTPALIASGITGQERAKAALSAQNPSRSARGSALAH